MNALNFTKLHGAGNDYVYIDGFQQTLPGDANADWPTLARWVSDRHQGIGADGLILILPATTPDADARMRMWNADGSEAEMCGNGIRCVAKYLFDRRLPSSRTDWQTPLQIQTNAGTLTVHVAETQSPAGADGQREVARLLRVDMGTPRLQAQQIPVVHTDWPADQPVLSRPLRIGQRMWLVTCVSMGNPHCVVFVPELTAQLVQQWGPQLERHEAFPQRTNVEFVQVLSRTEVRQRTWERGSGETQACGTGACAVCVAGAQTGRTARTIDNHLLGGTLRLSWDQETDHVWMTGPAAEVFSGQFAWPT